MDSDFHQQQYQHHFQEFPRQFHHPKPQTNNLTRFRSAPSSYFASFLDVAAETINTTGGGATGGGGVGGGEGRDFPNARPLSPETENIFNNFMSSIGADNNNSSSNNNNAVNFKRKWGLGDAAENNNSQKLSNIPENTVAQPEFTVRVKQETDLQQQGNYSNQPQMKFHSQSKPPLSNQHNSAVSSAMSNSLTKSSMGIAAVPHMRTGLGGSINKSSSLTRYSSSPAGFFDNLNIDITGYGMMGSTGTGNYGGGNEGNVQVNYSTGQSSTTDFMNQNTDVGRKIPRMNSLDEGIFNNQNKDRNFGYPMTSWDDSIMSENFGDDIKPFTELNSSENQSGEGKNRPPKLVHHLSLPNTLPDLSAIENFLNLQDTVPCRIRAKRGCATHPRSIAERVRRTKISERMRKLQDLVPNMDKQTNTADMLDLAVDYIKDLQKQVETLTDNRTQCTCSI